MDKWTQLTSATHAVTVVIFVINIITIQTLYYCSAASFKKILEHLTMKRKSL